MSTPIIIIGSGFAAYQLIKNIRRQDTSLPIQVFTADDGDEYNKPDLSHVFSKQQSAEQLVKISGTDFAMQHKVELFANTWVEKVDIQAQYIVANGQNYHYSKLVFATGASAFVPPVEGDGAANVITLNSLNEYRRAQSRIAAARDVLIMGGGLIGVELAMDICASGKKVTIVEPNSRLLANVTPDFVALKLEQQFRADGITLDLDNSVKAISIKSNGADVRRELNQSNDDNATGEASNGKTVLVTTRKGYSFSADCVISAAGLRPNTHLACQAGIDVGRGIRVDHQLRTSIDNIYALGDCAEIDGKVMAYLQPIILSANTLAKQLLNQESTLALPPMMVKVKTPSYPVQVGGQISNATSWQIGVDKQSITAKAYDENGIFIGFAVTDKNVSQAFPLLREVSEQNRL